MGLDKVFLSMNVMSSMQRGWSISYTPIQWNFAY